MFRTLKNSAGQIIMGEYILAFFLIVGVISAMTIYLQRTLQGRIHDSRDYMMNYVRIQTSQLDAQGNPYYSSPLYIGYEPYYSNEVSNTARNNVNTSTLRQGGTSGIYQSGISESARVESLSVTAPPKDAK